MDIMRYLERIDVPRMSVPMYPALPEGWCARYARLAAKDLFGLDYMPANAWDFHYRNNVVWKLESGRKWEEVIKPGHILGILYPESVSNTCVCGKKDGRGNDRLYTHLALYAGNDVIIHQFDDALLKSNIKRFLEADCRLIEILAPPSETFKT